MMMIGSSSSSTAAIQVQLSGRAEWGSDFSDFGGCHHPGDVLARHVGEHCGEVLIAGEICDAERGLSQKLGEVRDGHVVVAVWNQNVEHDFQAANDEFAFGLSRLGLQLLGGLESK